MLPIGPGAVKQEMTFPESWVWRGDENVGIVADRKKRFLKMNVKS